MNDDHDSRRLGDLLDGQRIAMVTTPGIVASAAGGAHLSARPLTLLEQDGPTLRFLVSRSAEWVQALPAGDAEVQVSFADPGDNRWVALSGAARVADDRALVSRLWNPAAGTFFDGPDDPDVVALEVEVRGGEWWDGPSGRIGQAVSMLRAAVTHDAEKAGDRGTVSPR